MSGVKVTGMKEAIAKFSRIHETVMRDVRSTMREQAETMKQMAQDFAPEDMGDLKDSITLTQGRDSERYTQFVLEFGEGTHSLTGKPIEQYAMLIHEHYEEIISNTTVDADGNKRRQRSIAKDRRTRAKYPKETMAFVGGKFLDRAAAITQKNLPDKLTKVVEATVEKE